ncbi:MAG: GGDEF domain-containing protein [Gammaproteobacteria bacterium]|nr:GGDEF domain-containing protein [Gammaproteobacteria bacterium]
MTQETSVISSLVELTKQRDQLAVRGKLLSTLMAATDASWIVFCRQVDGERIEILDRIPSPSPGKSSRHYSTELFDRIDAFQECARIARPVWVTDLAPYQAIIFRMGDTGSSDDFIVLFNAELDGRDERTAASILDLYQNFLELVIENTQDALTGLLNRGVFDRDLEAAALAVNSRNRRCDPPHGCGYLAMLDIDHFKSINDRFGHLYGDEVLLLFAKLFRDTFRSTDKLYRYGGEEFAVIIDNASETDVLALLERFRNATSQFSFPQVGNITVSIGAAPILSNNLPSNIVDRADNALYRAKNEGRNRVCMFQFSDQGSDTHAAQREAELF